MKSENHQNQSQPTVIIPKTPAGDTHKSCRSKKRSQPFAKPEVQDKPRGAPNNRVCQECGQKDSVETHEGSCSTHQRVQQYPGEAKKDQSTGAVKPSLAKVGSK